MSFLPGSQRAPGRLDASAVYAVHSTRADEGVMARIRDGLRNAADALAIGRRGA